MSEPTAEQKRSAEDRRRGQTFVYCPECERIITAYGKAGKVRNHRLDTHPDNWEWMEPNTLCPGSGQYGEVVEGEIYTSPVDSLKWQRVQ